MIVIYLFWEGSFIVEFVWVEGWKGVNLKIKYKLLKFLNNIIKYFFLEKGFVDELW